MSVGKFLKKSDPLEDYCLNRHLVLSLRLCYQGSRRSALCALMKLLLFLWFSSINAMLCVSSKVLRRPVEITGVKRTLEMLKSTKSEIRFRPEAVVRGSILTDETNQPPLPAVGCFGCWVIWRVRHMRLSAAGAGPTFPRPSVSSSNAMICPCRPVPKP